MRRRHTDLLLLLAMAIALAFAAWMITQPAGAHTDPALEAETTRLEEAIAATRGRGNLDPALPAQLAALRIAHPCRAAASTAGPHCHRSAPQQPRSATAAPPGGNTGMGSNVEQWRPLVASHFPAGAVDPALRVIACESGGNPNAYNPSGASGLFQVLSSWAGPFGVTPADLFDPATNIRIARALYDDGGGWAHWVCKP